MNAMFDLPAPAAPPDTWLQTTWRPVAAFVYLFICLTDFVFMPIYYEIVNPAIAPDKLVALALRFDGAAQVQALTTLHTETAWTPLTLRGGGLFHLAFGAILGVSALTRGQEQTERVRQDGATNRLVMKSDIPGAP